MRRGRVAVLHGGVEQQPAQHDAGRLQGQEAAAQPLAAQEVEEARALL